MEAILMIKAKKKKHPLLIKLGLALLTIFVVGSVIFLAYYFTKNKEDTKYIDQLYSYKENVDKSNVAVSNLAAGLTSVSVKDSVTLEIYKKKISTEITNLENVLQDIETLKPMAKYRTQYDNFVNGIRSNKDIFNQALQILKNTKSTRIKAAVKELSGFVSTTTQFYEAGKLKKAYIKLPTGILELPGKINDFAMGSYKFYQNRIHNMELYTAYFNSMDKLITDFSATKTDLGINIDQINAGSLSIDDVYLKIEDKLAEVSSLQTNYDAMSPPPKMGDRHKAFDDILKSYSYYCQDFKTALSSYEEALNNPDALSAAKQAFEDLKTKYSTLSKNFTDYWNAYNGDKVKYSDVNNL